ncbi:hypothetical protein B0H66DRAFT_566023 [Apodospora peruviana]|uniref:DUF6536 domain-containing protein n=1 Tax=Apodospora peruviana TaxID=516989 RepID=A0AAE0M098_9PEZI|nr:hypothetical protein B0H66DRAFT_566023 [Apodospora peruviana]
MDQWWKTNHRRLSMPFKRFFSRFRGWRHALKLLSILSWLLVVPAFIVSTALTRSSESMKTVEIKKGSCPDITVADTWIHLAMNVFSSALFAATNFAMQAWTAPTRSDIDQVHKTGQTIDIGVQSLRNLTRIQPKRLFFWTVMFLVALPLHFVFNSAVYKTSIVNSYTASVVNAKYFDLTFTRSTNDSHLYTAPRRDGGIGEWEELPISNLVARYTTGLPDRFRDVVFVTVGDNGTDAGVVLDQQVADGTDIRHQIDWIYLHVGNATQAPQAYHDMDYSSPVWYMRENRSNFFDIYPLAPTAFSEKVEPECRLLANPLFWWLTTACTLAIACSLTSILYLNKSTPLVTVGDAIDSFLTKPSDVFTTSASTNGYSSFRNMFQPRLVPRAYYSTKTRRWWKAVGLTRWALTGLWFTGIIIALVVSWFVSRDKSERDVSFQKMFANGFGTFGFTSVVNAQRRTGSVSQELQLVALANTPQFASSVTYLFYNIILTTMVAEREWQGIGRPRKQKQRLLKRFAYSSPTSSSLYLRVSQPRGNQRDTYFLSLPYRYSIPLLIITTAEKWLASQALFYTVVDVWDSDGQRTQEAPNIAALGYSGLALFLLIIFTSTSWVGIVMLGVVRKYPSTGAGGKPLLGTCSGVIAASCHLSAAELKKQQAGQDIAAGALSWGVIKQVVYDEDGDGKEEQWLGFMVAPGEEDEGPEMPRDGQVYG